ncbi:unnamed protein product [Rotaria socialis]|uniref:Uncharacterized protein n=1 Tax=Rotaria socialis TaxID=392032 RepID=A0A818BF90_9BILA|nr:unnamed protein product [Rotaria socialis]
MAIPIIISKSGNHTFTTESNVATCGFLHRNSFDPENPSSNLVAQGCNNGEKRQYKFSVVLETSTTVSKRENLIQDTNEIILKNSLIFFISVSSLSDNGGKIAGIIVGSVVGGLIIFSCCCILNVLGVWSLILYLKGGPVLSNKLYIRSAFGVYSGTGNIIFQPGTFSSYYFKNGSWHGPHDLVLGFYPEANYIVHGRGRDEMGAFAIT